MRVWSLLLTPQDPSQRPPRDHILNAIYPLANPAHTGKLETALAYPTFQNNRTEQHRRPQTHMLSRNLSQPIDQYSHALNSRCLGNPFHA